MSHPRRIHRAWILTAADAHSACDASDRPADRVLQGVFRARKRMGRRDRAFVADLVFAMLRSRRRLDAVADHADPPLDPVERVVAHLVLDGVPDDALAIDDVIVARARGAVSRWRDRPTPTDPRDQVAEAWSVPRWLVDAWATERSVDALPAIAEAFRDRAPLTIRTNPLRATRDEVAAALAAEGVETRPTRWSPLGLHVEGRIQSRRSPSFGDGLWEVQDEGSQLLAVLCAAEPGQTVVDACAGAGGKTLALAAAMQGRGSLYAFDNDERRLGGLRPRARRADAHNIRTEVVDRPNHPRLKRLKGRVDTVLIDAPCSGLGVLRRNPDAARRVTPDWLDELQGAQRGLLEQYADVVRPGGRMVYATCSVLGRENQDAVDDFVARHPDWRRVPVRDVLEAAGVPVPDGVDTDLTLWPDLHGTDGFFAAVLERTEG